VAPTDRSISIFGDAGVLFTPTVRDDASPVFLRRTPPNRIVAALLERMRHVRSRIEYLVGTPWSVSGLTPERRLRYVRRPRFICSGGGKPVDFMRGPQELADAIHEKRPCRLSPELGLHMTELIETLQYPERFPRPRILRTSFAPIEPLAWEG
jgi:hypothetical protein